MRFSVQNCQAEVFQKMTTISAEEASVYKRRANMEPVSFLEHSQKFRKTIVHLPIKQVKKYNQSSFQSQTPNPFSYQSKLQTSFVTLQAKKFQYFFQSIPSNNMLAVRNSLQSKKMIGQQNQNCQSQCSRKKSPNASKVPLFLYNRFKNGKRHQNLILIQGQQKSKNLVECRERLRFSKPVQSLNRNQQTNQKVQIPKKNCQTASNFGKQLNKVGSFLQFSRKIPKKFKKTDSKSYITQNCKIDSDNFRRISCHQLDNYGDMTNTEQFISKEEVRGSYQFKNDEAGLYRISSLSNLTKNSLESTQDIEKPVGQIQLKKGWSQKENRKTHQINQTIQIDVSLKKVKSQQQKTAQRTPDLTPIQQQTKTPLKEIKKSNCSRAEFLTLSRQFSFLFSSDCKEQQDNTAKIEQYWNQFEDVLFS